MDRCNSQFKIIKQHHLRILTYFSPSLKLLFTCISNFTDIYNAKESAYTVNRRWYKLLHLFLPDKNPENHSLNSSTKKNPKKTPTQTYLFSSFEKIIIKTILAWPWSSQDRSMDALNFFNHILKTYPRKKLPVFKKLFQRKETT